MTQQSNKIAAKCIRHSWFFSYFKAVSEADGDDDGVKNQPPSVDEERDNRADERQLPDVARVNDNNADSNED
jgi:hypothetical protein